MTPWHVSTAPSSRPASPNVEALPRAPRHRAGGRASRHRRAPSRGRDLGWSSRGSGRGWAVASRANDAGPTHPPNRTCLPACLLLFLPLPLLLLLILLLPLGARRATRHLQRVRARVRMQVRMRVRVRVRAREPNILISDDNIKDPHLSLLRDVPVLGSLYSPRAAAGRRGTNEKLLGVEAPTKSCWAPHLLPLPFSPPLFLLLLLPSPRSSPESTSSSAMSWSTPSSSNVWRSALGNAGSGSPGRAGGRQPYPSPLTCVSSETAASRHAVTS